ncbi:TPA: septum formation inhibitor Maf [Candidatus Woesearchaeota archaeon]|nr:septum formation inhibitor Maf [Candidatus Woesearchaeota archaeon]
MRAPTRIILASTSPRRKMLLEQIGLEFEIIPGDYEEDMTLPLPPHKLVMTLAKGKAMSVARKQKSGIIVAVDTVVALGEKVLGKPKNAADAKRMLKSLSGKTNVVYSGMCVIDAKTGKTLQDYEETMIVFRRLTTAEIDAYVATGEPLDKAGAYAMQGIAALFIERVEGCYSNVIGLPLPKLAKMLAKFGVKTI